MSNTYHKFMRLQKKKHFFSQRQADGTYMHGHGRRRRRLLDDYTRVFVLLKHDNHLNSLHSIL